MPVAYASTGPLTYLDHELLHHYTTNTWESFAVRDDAIIRDLYQECVPRLGVAHSYLLYALLSIAASHSNGLRPSKKIADRALVYRQKTFELYTKALQNITAENYEAVLATGTFLLALVPPPVARGPESDDEHLDWMLSLLKLSEGLRLLASLRWNQGIEKLSIYPLICREMRTLPPPPLITGTEPDAPVGPLGTTPDRPNPAPTYCPQQPQATRLFLPPALMALLESLSTPQDQGPLELHRGTLYPVFHALSPIFLSLYYYHLNPDFYVRVFSMTSFVMPDFVQLVKDREPRALTLMSWWFAMADLVTTRWWVGTKVVGVVDAIGRVIRAGSEGDPYAVNESIVGKALCGAEKIVAIFESYGRDAAAKSIFEGWEGVLWEEGPQRAKEWDLVLSVEISELDLQDLQ